MLQSIINVEFLIVCFFLTMGFSFVFLSGFPLRRIDRIDLIFKTETNYPELITRREKEIYNLIWIWRFLSLIEIVSFIISGYLVANALGGLVFGIIIIPEIIRQKRHIPSKNYDPLVRLGESITFTNRDGAIPTAENPQYAYLHQITGDRIRSFVNDRNLSEDMIEKTFNYLLSHYGAGNEILLEIRKEFLGNLFPS